MATAMVTVRDVNRLEPLVVGIVGNEIPHCVQYLVSCNMFTS